MSLAMNQAEREQYLADLHVGVISMPDPAAGPLTAPIWYDYEPSKGLWVLISPTSRKGKLAEVGKRISLVAQSEDMPYKYVSVEGPIIDIAEDDRELHEIPMAMRYLGEAQGRAYIDSLPPSEWRRYILRPERWLTMDGSKN